MKKTIPMGHVLLTGATGLLGHFLMRDALVADQPLVVLTRDRKTNSARERIEQDVLAWEERLQRFLPRPVVIAGELSESGIGVDSSDASWISRHCETVLHSAASVRFYADSQTQEPYRTNLDGTRHLLEFCRRHRIVHFHHVSTAYVCGQRDGDVWEMQLDAGQAFGNDYERSKFHAELLVRHADFLESATIYRPSIIVGELATGRTTTFHGYYTPLQLAWFAFQGPTEFPDTSNWFLQQLGLDGDEGKNLVPVDWVASVIGKIVEDRRRWGSTYHLTNPQATSVRQMLDSMSQAINDALAKRSQGNGQRQTPSVDVAPAAILAGVDFRQQMEPYRAYFRNDPTFHQDALAEADVPACPVLERDDLVRTARFAIASGFQRPRSPQAGNSFAEDLLSQAVAEHLSLARGGDDDDDGADLHALATMSAIQFQVLGPGGTTCYLEYADDTPMRLFHGTEPHATGTVVTRLDILRQLLAGQLGWDQAIVSGHCVVWAEPISEAKETGVDALPSSGSNLASPAELEIGPAMQTLMRRLRRLCEPVEAMASLALTHKANGR
ncbi:MAG: SDR family oxidoreductase [Planctomycetales bacterium]|nr:SDR family oxidoreductase [Planctomycetales bacterium]